MARSRKTRRAEAKVVQQRTDAALRKLKSEYKTQKASRKVKASRQKDRCRTGGRINRAKNWLDL
jgi:hypothetical protein